MIELSDIVAHILNCSFKSGKVPSYWLNTLVSPVPKVNKPVKISNYRPISVTPLFRANRAIADLIDLPYWYDRAAGFCQ